MKNLFDEVVIMGSGPTTFDYNELSRIHEPIFFINGTHQFSDICPSKHKYFFTHHISRYTDVMPVTVWIKAMYFDEEESYGGCMYAKTFPKNEYITIDCQADDEVITPEFLARHPFLLDRDEVSNRNRLLAGFGSATTAIHAAWFAGCKKITFIGCNPDMAGIARDVRIGGQLDWSPDKVKENNRQLPKLLGLNVVHK